MASKATIFYFQTLAVLAVILLWGVSIWNGTVKALIYAFITKRLDENVPLRTTYTGILIIDFPLTLLVAFFHYGTSAEDMDYQYFLLDAYSLLQTAFVWLYVEMVRPGNKPKSISNPIIFGLLWQAFGGAIALPFYYSLHLKWMESATLYPVTDVGKARAIFISYVIGALSPAVIGMLPTWLGPAYRSADTHQLILGWWQLDPIWVSLTYVLVTRLWPSASKKKRDMARESHRWIKGTYALVAICSSAGHLFTTINVLGSDDHLSRKLSRMYVPALFDGPADASNILMRGPWLFLQYDLIIMSLSSLSWVFVLSVSMSEFTLFQQMRLWVFFLIGVLVIGPGAVVSLVLSAREQILYDRHGMEYAKRS